VRVVYLAPAPAGSPAPGAPAASGAPAETAPAAGAPTANGAPAADPASSGAPATIPPPAPAKVPEPPLDPAPAPVSPAPDPAPAPPAAPPDVEALADAVLESASPLARAMSVLEATATYRQELERQHRDGPWHPETESRAGAALIQLEEAMADVLAEVGYAQSCAREHRHDERSAPRLFGGVRRALDEVERLPERFSDLDRLFAATESLQALAADQTRAQDRLNMRWRTTQHYFGGMSIGADVAQRTRALKDEIQALATALADPGLAPVVAPPKVEPPAATVIGPWREGTSGGR
jgi:hypothetical protein